MPIPHSWSLKKKHAAQLKLIMPTCKPDWDNLGKSAADALNEIVYKTTRRLFAARSKNIIQPIRQSISRSGRSGRAKGPCVGKRSNFKRRNVDNYPTPPAAIDPLLAFISAVGFYEPCAGDGRLRDYLVANGHV